MEKALSVNGSAIALPEKELLVERLAHSLTFAKNVLQHLIVEGNQADESDPWFVRNEKIIAETAFLVAFSNNIIYSAEIIKARKELIEVLEPLARSKAMLLNICMQPPLALDYAHAHICLSYAGYPDERFDKALSAALQSSSVEGIERTPYRMMEGEWLKQRWKSDYESNFDFWIPLSCLHHEVDIFSPGSDGAYSVTHAIMYAAFGKKHIPGTDPGIILQWVESLLVRYMDEQNYDIAGELLMAWPLLNKHWSSTAAFALNCLFQIEERVGFLPAPGLERSLVDNAEDKNAKRTYIYSINYHTALVMGLLCSSILENPLKENVCFNSIDCTKAWKSKIENEIFSEKEIHWKKFFLDLDSDQRDQLLPMLYQVCILRWVRDKKFGNVKSLLEISSDELRKLSISRQAEELLQRLSLFTFD